MRRALLLLLGFAVLLASAATVTTARPAHTDDPPTQAVVRWGIASSRELTHDASRLRALGATWSYDWSAQSPAPTAGLQWVPMVWGRGSVTAATISALSAERRDGRAVDLLGFNEPDSAGQSNLSPLQAAALWPQLERTGLRLGSPAPAVPSDGWLAGFMALARRRHLRVDFIALHFYQDFTAPSAVAQLRDQLLEIHRAYRLPVWITEIGTLDIADRGEPMQSPATESRALRYLREIVPMLDRLGFVQRVAWFTDDCWNDLSCHTSSLEDAPGHLTALGRTFRLLTAPPA